jgi:hypothetical protein
MEYKYLHKQNNNTDEILFFNIELTNEEMEKMAVLDKNKRFTGY